MEHTDNNNNNNGVTKSSFHHGRKADRNCGGGRGRGGRGRGGRGRGKAAKKRCEVPPSSEDNNDSAACNKPPRQLKGGRPSRKSRENNINLEGRSARGCGKYVL